MRLPSCRRCHEAGTAYLILRISRGAGRKPEKDVPCDGKGYPCYSDQACGPSAQYAYAQYYAPEKQKEKASETMDIYAPIAQRLGISKIKVELDDLSLKYLEPDAYYDLVQKVSMKRKSVRNSLSDAIVKEVTRISRCRH